MIKTRFRCQCGYEASEEARPGYALVAVYHLHPGPSGWGTQPFRMEPVSSPIAAQDLETREMATVA
jgi:hypothetical protein